MEKREGGTVADGAGLTPQALDTLRSLDSLSYGLLDLQSKNESSSSGSGIGGVAGRERVPVTRDLIQKGVTHLRGSVASLSHSPVSQAQIISLIAHLHLLLDEFTHAYSAYSQYRRLSVTSESDPALFYGLGIIHRHHGQHKQSEEAYRKVLALAPSFPRSGEVHLQLGRLAKRRKSYSEAAAHLEKALGIPDPQLDKLLVEFHLGHVWELQGLTAHARSKYEALLNCRSLSTSLKGLTQKQLGWLLHCWPETGGEGARERALELLTQASQNKPGCGETWYLLGRVLVTHQKCHEAFSAYQKAIHYPSKVSPANTWHSIGHLYFQMQQPRDSLQAYLCCVYLDIFHIQGWKSLGCLYEAVVFPTEALICYQNAVTAFAKKCVRVGKDVAYVQGRIEALSNYLAMVGVNQLPIPAMPRLHEAWTTLVPDHIRRNRPNPGTPLLTLEQVKGQYQVDSYSKSIFALPQPPSYPSPSPTSLMTPVTPGSASSVGVNRNGNFPTPPSSETTSNHIQNGNFSFTPASHGGGGGGYRAVVKSEELDLNLDNLDFEALAAVANALPSPRSLSATRSTSNCETATSTHPPATSHSTSCSLQPTLAAEPPTLPPTLSSPSLSLPAGISSSSSPFISSSSSHTTDLAWSQQQNWPSYLMKQADAGASGLTNGPPFQTAPSVPPFLQHPTTPRNLPQPQMSLPAQSVSAPPHPSAPVRSLSLTTGGREKSAPRKRRSNSSSNSKSRSRRASQTGVCNSQLPRPLLAEQPSLAGFSGVKTETMIGFPPPLPPGLASHPSLLSQLQSASASTSSLLTPVSLPGGGFNSSLSHLTSGGLTNISSFDVFPQLPSSLSSPSVGLVPGTNVNQTVPPSTTVCTTGRTGTNVTPSVNATPNSTVADANSFFVNTQMLPFSTAGHPDCSFSTSGQDLNPTTKPPHDEKLALKKPRLSPANESRNTTFSSTSLSSGAHPVAVAVSESVVTRELIPTGQDHHLQLAESTHPPTPSQPLLPPSFSQPLPSSSSSTSLPFPSSCQLSAPTSASSSLVDQLLEALQEKQSGVGGGKGDCSPSESSSGISSAGTNASAFFPSSTAESSPVDAHSLMTSSAPLSPSLISSHPLPLYHISTSSHSDGRAADSPQLSPSGPSPRGGPDQNITITEPLLFGSSRGAPESETAGNDSDLIFPQVPFPSLASLKEYMILEPELRPPKQPPFQPGMELRPDCPVYEVTGCGEKEWENLLEFCNNPDNPICIIRGLVETIGLDLSQFYSQCLVDTCASHEMEVREQMKQAADENCDIVSGKQVWKCESSKSITTVAEYASYQQKMLQKEREEGVNTGCVRDSGGEREFLSFGTNLDISDHTIWSQQLQELTKLPQFLRVNCPESNLLSHIGHTVLGMNSVQLYMKVAGSRTPGHQENNNFCSLNVNIGPGTCEWFAVPNCYWGVLHNLCEKHKVNFLIGSWWPVLEELYQHKVPVYRFTQHKGEVVFINPGTIHWVQANGVCNNIAWNTGPLTAHQFRMAWERYQWNKIQKVRSIVPMVHLTWNLARRIRLNDSHFYWQVRSLLESSLAQTNLLLSHLKKAGIPIVWHGRLAGEPAPYCNNCVEEVFNVLFVLSHRGEYLVYCHRCASSMRKTFKVLQQYDIEELKDILAVFSHHLPDL